MDEHDDKVRAVCAQVRELAAEGQPVHIQKGGVHHFVPLPGDARFSGRAVDVSALNAVLDVDVEARTCTAEPGATFAQVVRRTLADGLVPKVVPELEGITLGGAVAGCSVESMSFRYGGFHDTCLRVRGRDRHRRAAHARPRRRALPHAPRLLRHARDPHPDRLRAGAGDPRGRADLPPPPRLRRLRGRHARALRGRRLRLRRRHRPRARPPGALPRPVRRPRARPCRATAAPRSTTAARAELDRGPPDHLRLPASATTPSATGSRAPPRRSSGGRCAGWSAAGSSARRT